MTTSLNEIRNLEGQLQVASAADIAPIVGIPSGAPVVTNLDSNKLQGFTADQLKAAFNVYIDAKLEGFESIFGKVNTINGVSPDIARDLTLRAVGDIQVVPDPENNTVVLYGHTGINGMIKVNVLTVPDGLTKAFELEAPSGFIDGPEIMFFLDGILLKPVTDYTFDKYTYIVTLSDDFVEVPDSSDQLQVYIRRNGAVNQGLVRMVPDSGAVDGTNDTFFFASGELTLDNTLVWRNGGLLKPGDDFIIVDSNKVQLAVIPALGAYLEFIALRPFGGLLEEFAMAGTMDGVNSVFSISDSDVVTESAFVWEDGALMNRDGGDFTIDPVNRTITFALPPAPDTNFRLFKINMERNIVSINGLLPDMFKNIRIASDGSLSIVTDYEQRQIVISQPAWKTDTTVLTANDQIIPLSASCIAGSEIVFHDGLFIEPDLYTVVDDVVTPTAGVFVSGKKVSIKFQVKP